ncbi:FMN-dependent NADH-azoreductase [Metallibacterium scheffleri]|uniref:FMN dependent NADH:quinone oxidoreductase n=1 Tax=Metallibacterium scheffleri TaxID=993689 RepID=A0A4S3KNP0_9GAMM|nr:NAD(P)H-dependent oxidoreductase [Metallibacterium scheffleri]THD10585.1 hypothetical protein B1806_07745 [Metallibacterium scheffleri]
MKTLLHVSASPRHAASHSRKAAAAAIAHLQLHHPALQVIERDLGMEPLPHPDAAFVQASLLPDAQRDAAQRVVLRLSDRLIAELSSADAIVLSTPMHNFTLPSVLKAWIDHVVRPRQTFRLDANGKTGLLRDRPVRVVLASGGSLGAEPGGQVDFVTPYLRYVFEVIGLRDFKAVSLENCNRRTSVSALPTITSSWLDIDCRADHCAPIG